MKRKYYTIGEANAVLPEVKKAAAEIRAAEQSRNEKQKAYSELMLAISSNGGDISQAYLQKLIKSVERAERRVHRLLENLRKKYQCEIKGLEPLLIDFYALRDGREVYLCWREDEDEITHWHDLDAGYAGREPI